MNDLSGGSHNAGMMEQVGVEGGGAGVGGEAEGQQTQSEAGVVGSVHI